MTGDFAKAIVDYDEAIRLDPTNATYHFFRGQTWRDRGDAAKALNDYNEAIRLDPKHDLARCKRGDLWKSRKEYAKATADYGEAIRIDPKNAEANNSQAWLWATCPDGTYRNGKRAVECATLACELTGWKQANYLDTIAAAYAESGDFANAIQWQEKAMELNTNDADRPRFLERLEQYRKHKPWREAG